MSGSRTGNRGQLSGPGSLRGRGKLNGPGSLADPGSLTDPAQPGATADGVPTGQNTMIPEGDLAELAKSYGLKPSAARPPMWDYLKSLWQRRYFITGFATARNVAMYTESRLGQVWQILTPLLNVAVYYLIFGFILDTSRGVDNFIAFLVIGVFVFNFTQRSFIISSRVMFDSLPLIRALYFPRACLPLGYVLIELQQLAISLVVIFATVLAVGEPITWYWLLVIPILLMQTLFNVGCALLLARLGAGFDDVSQLLPFIVRTWFYASGVMFSIQTFRTLALRPVLTQVLQYNPAAIYITLTRDALMRSQRISSPGAQPYNKNLCIQYYLHSSEPQYILDSGHCHAIIHTSTLWYAGAGWALVALVAGFILFWRAEVQYGRG
jgi:teichoic acid transport system permease protein